MTPPAELEESDRIDVHCGECRQFVMQAAVLQIVKVDFRCPQCGEIGSATLEAHDPAGVH